MNWIAAMKLTDYILVLMSNWAGVPNKVASECIYTEKLKGETSGWKTHASILK